MHIQGFSCPGTIWYTNQWRPADYHQDKKIFTFRWQNSINDQPPRSVNGSKKLGRHHLRKEITEWTQRSFAKINPSTKLATTLVLPGQITKKSFSVTLWDNLCLVYYKERFKPWMISKMRCFVPIFRQPFKSYLLNKTIHWWSLRLSICYPSRGKPWWRCLYFFKKLCVATHIAVSSSARILIRKTRKKSP